MNQATFIGNLTRQAEVKTINGGNSFTTFTLAVSRRYKTRDGTKKEDTSFIECIMNGNTQNLLPYLQKGSKVCVVGRVSCHAWIDKQNQAHANLDLNVRELELIGSSNSQPTAQPTQQPQAFAPSQQSMQPQQQVLSQDFLDGNKIYSGSDDLPF